MRDRWTPSISFLVATGFHVLFLLLIGRHYLASSATPDRLNQAAQKLTTVKGQPVRFVYVKDMVPSKEPPLDRTRVSDMDRRGASPDGGKGQSPDPTSLGRSPVRQSGGPGDAPMTRPSVPAVPASPPPTQRPGAGGQGGRPPRASSPPVRPGSPEGGPARNSASKTGQAHEGADARAGIAARDERGLPLGGERGSELAAAIPGAPGLPARPSPGGVGSQIQRMMVGSLQGGYDNPNASRLNSGALSFDTAAWDLGPYARQVQERVQSNWHVPEAQMVLRQKGWVAIRFNIQRDGTVTDLQVIRPSGIPSYDQSAMNAMRSSSPLPPLPKEVTVPQLGGVFRFFYNMSDENGQ